MSDDDDDFARERDDELDRERALEERIDRLTDYAPMEPQTPAEARALALRLGHE